MTEVAIRKKGCKICDGGPDVFQSVNEAVWDGREPTIANRVRGYRATGLAVLATFDIPGDVRLITRHAAHVERGHRDTHGNSPPSSRELTVYSTDFASVTDRFAGLGMRAAQELESRMASGELEDKALVGVASMGLKAVGDREKAQRADRAPQINIQAIFGVSGGFLKGEVSEYHVIEGEFTELDLKAQVESARTRAKELQAG